MSETFVLIAGGWHGGWAWRVAEHLRTSGHRVATLPLPGLTDGDDPTRYRLSDVVDFVVDYVELFTRQAATSGNNTVALPFEVWQGAFMQDASEDVQRLVHSLLVPQPMQYFTEAVPALDLNSLGVPASYIITTDDIALPPGEYGWTPRYPTRLGVTPIEAPGSHEACFTRPAELADALLKA